MDQLEQRPAAEPRTDEHEPSRRWRWGALAVTCVAMILRSPGLLLSPRLWAEEATIYYVYARHHDLLPSLFLVPSSRGPAGYLSLVPNTAATFIIEVPESLAVGRERRSGNAALRAAIRR